MPSPSKPLVVPFSLSNMSTSVELLLAVLNIQFKKTTSNNVHVAEVPRGGVKRAGADTGPLRAEAKSVSAAVGLGCSMNAENLLRPVIMSLSRGLLGQWDPKLRCCHVTCSVLSFCR